MADYAPKVNVSITGLQQLRNATGQFISYAKSDLIFPVAEEVAAEMQEAMRSGASWKNRTGEARNSLFAVAQTAGEAKLVPAAPQPPVPGRMTASRGAGGVSAKTTETGSYAITIVAYGTADQNLWLEIAMGMRFAIIGPSLLPWGQVLKERLDQRFKSG